MQLYRYINQINSYEHTCVILLTFDVVSETKKGYWFKDFTAIIAKRFVLKNSRKRFCHITKELALESFKKRKKKQIQILSYQLQCARDALHTAEEINNEHIDSITTN